MISIKNIFSSVVKFSFVCTILLFSQGHAQEISGSELLNKAIAYHDPGNNYDTFKNTLVITTQTPDGKERKSTMKIDATAQNFELKTVRNDKEVLYQITNDSVQFTLDGKSTFTDEEAKAYNLTKARAIFMKNYYTYLYGLPMKLKDSGTIIDPVVERKNFMGKEYLVLAVKYEEGVGKDAWFFYFDPTTYALKVYQFYHDQTKNDGEYILLSEEEELSGIKIPKVRAWYLNKDEKYLATDTLSKI
jgi:hypothetical protein